MQNKAYPFFNENQVLTKDHLNNLVNYLELEDRESRIAKGRGIQCGLEVSFHNDNSSIALSRGVGSTSQGYLLVNYDSKSFTHYQSYLPAEKSQQYTFESDKNRVFELLVDDKDPDDKNEENPNAYGLSQFNSNTSFNLQNDFAVVLYLEIVSADLTTCKIDSCDNEGYENQLKWYPLLVHKDTLKLLLQDKHNYDGNTIDYFHSKYDVEECRIGTPLLECSNTRVYRGIHESFREVCELSIESIRSVVAQSQEAYGRYIDVYTEAFITLVESHLDNSASFYFRNKVDGIQYFYDHLKDITIALNEFNNYAFVYHCQCSLDKELFPYHLMAGSLSGIYLQEYKDDVFRHYYEPVCEHTDSDNKRKKLLNLFLRLRTVVTSFHVEYLEGSLNSQNTPALYITPENRSDDSLDGYTPGYYYAHKKNGNYRELLTRWNYERFIHARGSGTPFYWRNSLVNITNGNKHIIRHSSTYAPLLYRKDTHNHFRIEGHLGREVESFVNNFETLKRYFNLPIDLKLLEIRDEQECEFVAPYKNSKELETLFTLEQKELCCYLRKLFHLLGDILLLDQQGNDNSDGGSTTKEPLRQFHDFFKKELEKYTVHQSRDTLIRRGRDYLVELGKAHRFRTFLYILEYDNAQTYLQNFLDGKRVTNIPLPLVFEYLNGRDSIGILYFDGNIEYVSPTSDKVRKLVELFGITPQNDDTVVKNVSDVKKRESVDKSKDDNSKIDRLDMLNMSYESYKDAMEAISDLSTDHKELSDKLSFIGQIIFNGVYSELPEDQRDEVKPEMVEIPFRNTTLKVIKYINEDQLKLYVEKDDTASILSIFVERLYACVNLFCNDKIAQSNTTTQLESLVVVLSRIAETLLDNIGPKKVKVDLQDTDGETSAKVKGDDRNGISVRATEIQWTALLIQIQQNLSMLISTCWYSQFIFLKKQYAELQKEILKEILFHQFVEKHPGLEHTAGVPKGGTFVVAYKKVFQGKRERALIMADFSLPYICCGDGAVDYIVFAELKVNLPEKVCSDYRFQIDYSPIGATLSGNGVEHRSGEDIYYFNPEGLVGEQVVAISLGYKTVHFSTTVIEKPEASFVKETEIPVLNEELNLYEWTLLVENPREEFYYEWFDVNNEIPLLLGVGREFTLQSGMYDTIDKVIFLRVTNDICQTDSETEHITFAPSFQWEFTPKVFCNNGTHTITVVTPPEAELIGEGVLSDNDRLVRLSESQYLLNCVGLPANSYSIGMKYGEYPTESIGVTVKRHPNSTFNPTTEVPQRIDEDRQQWRFLAVAPLVESWEYQWYKRELTENSPIYTTIDLELLRAEYTVVAENSNEYIDISGEYDSLDFELVLVIKNDPCISIPEARRFTFRRNPDFSVTPDNVCDNNPSVTVLYTPNDATVQLPNEWIEGEMSPIITPPHNGEFTINPRGLYGNHQIGLTVQGQPQYMDTLTIWESPDSDFNPTDVEPYPDGISQEWTFEAIEGAREGWVYRWFTRDAHDNPDSVDTSSIEKILENYEEVSEHDGYQYIHRSGMYESLNFELIVAIQNGPCEDISKVKRFVYSRDIYYSLTPQQICNDDGNVVVNYSPSNAVVTITPELDQRIISEPSNGTFTLNTSDLSGTFPVTLKVIGRDPQVSNLQIFSHPYSDFTHGIGEGYNPSVTIAADGQKVTVFTAPLQGGGNFTYEWDHQGGNNGTFISDGGSLSVKWNPAESLYFTLRLTVKNSGLEGCEDVYPAVDTSPHSYNFPAEVEHFFEELPASVCNISDGIELIHNGTISPEPYIVNHNGKEFFLPSRVTFDYTDPYDMSKTVTVTSANNGSVINQIISVQRTASVHFDTSIDSQRNSVVIHNREELRQLSCRWVIDGFHNGEWVPFTVVDDSSQFTGYDRIDYFYTIDNGIFKPGDTYFIRITLQFDEGKCLPPESVKYYIVGQEREVMPLLDMGAPYGNRTLYYYPSDNNTTYRGVGQSKIADDPLFPEVVRNGAPFIPQNVNFDGGDRPLGIRIFDIMIGTGLREILLEAGLSEENTDDVSQELQSAKFILRSVILNSADRNKEIDEQGESGIKLSIDFNEVDNDLEYLTSVDIDINGSSSTGRFGSVARDLVTALESIEEAGLENNKENLVAIREKTILFGEALVKRETSFSSRTYAAKYIPILNSTIDRIFGLQDINQRDLLTNVKSSQEIVHSFVGTVEKL